MRNKIALALTGVFLISIIIAVNVYLLTRTVQPSPTEENDIPIAYEAVTVTFINRSVWGANNISPSLELPDLVTPVKKIVIAHTNDDTCTDNKECEETVSFLQRKYIGAKNKLDLPFNFLIGGNGVIYEGTGWTTQSDTTAGYDSDTLYIGFIGKFDDVLPSNRQLNAAKQLIEIGVNEGLINEAYKLLGQCQVYGSLSSPGKVLLAVIAQWKNFDKTLQCH